MKYLNYLLVGELRGVKFDIITLSCMPRLWNMVKCLDREIEYSGSTYSSQLCACDTDKCNSLIDPRIKQTSPNYSNRMYPSRIWSFITLLPILNIFRLRLLTLE